MATEQSKTRVRCGSSGAAAVVFLLAWVLISLGLSRGKSHVDKTDLYGTPAETETFSSVSPALEIESAPAVGDTLPTRSERLERLHRAAAERAHDTTGRMVRDSLGRLVRVPLALPVDSTARVKQFTYRRKDEPQVSLFQPTFHPFFLRPNYSVYRREVSLDSTGTMVTIRETVDGKDVKVPLVVPLSDYIRLSFAAAEQRGFEELAHRYKAREKKDELTELLSSVTNIDIPIPPNPILTLFGGRGINLRISGAVDIRAGFRSQKTDQATISALGNVQNAPDFNQDVQINVNGTIGDKLNINADWNTQRTFDYENQLKIKYTGYEDEIVQSVEAGNVSLSTPSSFIGSSQALFGFKAAFLMGPLKLTTLASQKKGQIKEVSLSGGAQDQTFELRAYQYSTSHYFLDTLYRSSFSPYYDGPNFTPVIDPRIYVTDEEVWVQSVTSVTPPEARNVVAYIILDPRPQQRYPDSLWKAEPIPGQIEVGQFVKLSRDQYVIHRETGYITLNTDVRPEQAIAVAYKIKGEAAGEIVFGDFTNVARDTSAPLVLKLVKPANLDPRYKVAWSLMLKNIYPIGGRDLKKEKFNASVYYQPPGAEPQDNIAQVNLLQLLRLDKTDEAGTGPPDNKFDFTPGITIDATRGEIIFPSLEPFREGIISGFSKNHVTVPPDSFIYSDVYDTTVTAARYNSIRDRFSIKGTYSAGITSTYSLGFNVVDGSVQVLLNGRSLTANTDYVMDYSTGQLIIRNADALLPGANVQVKYEQNDLFALASKTLLGARGDLLLSSKTAFGFTIMNLNQQTLSDKVRLDEEPTNNTIFGIDGTTSFDADILTRAVNLLPMMNSRTPSNVTLRGEAAYMRPDPNTSKSPIPIDNGKGIAYIDDFEGIKRTIPLGTSYGVWHYSSVPRYILGLDPDRDHPIQDTVKVYSKAKTIWYNISPSDVSVKQVWPNKTVAQGEDQQTVLNIDYFPRERGVYNYSLDLESTLQAGPKNNWGGIMRLLSSTANNLVDENINFIEIWAKVVGDGRDAKMMIDLGQISEDVIPNGKLDTEDGINPAFPVRNNILNDGEDVGIDGLTDDQERQAYAAFVSKYAQYSADPAGDDYHYASGSADFSQVNGTEGNGNSEIGRLPDTEDLNNNGIVDLINSYFEYEISLDTTGGASKNPDIVGGGSNGWYQFRIPLINFAKTVGDPSFSIVQFIRVWFTGCDQPVEIRIADFNLVGNNWQEEHKGDSTFSVTTVSVEDNPDYDSPPGVVRARDRTRPDQNILANEQSMALVFGNVPDGERRQAFRYFSSKPLDLFNYRAMKMFVRGDTHLQYSDTSNYDVELFLRFGIDTLNYYEYREPVHPGNPIDPATLGWDPLNNIELQFSEITSVKQARDSMSQAPVRYPTKRGPPGSTYSVLGNPTLTQVIFISIGIENPQHKGTSFPISGQILVDELRLTDVDDEPGFAYRVDASVKIADLATIGINFSKVDPTFHSLEDRFGSRSTGVNWGVSANVSLERFLPDSWVGTSIPLSYSHVEGINKPKYLPGTDVLVAEAAKRQGELAGSRGASPQVAQAANDSVLVASQTLRVSQSWAVPNARIALPTDKWYIRDTFNKLSLGFNYSTVSERNPTSTFSQTWAWAGKLSYALTFNPDNYITPFKSLFGGLPVLKDYKDIKLFFTPTTFSWGIGAQRSQTTGRMRTQTADNPIGRSFISNRSVAFGWKFTEGGLLNLSLDYGLDISSDLTYLETETDSSKAQRPFSQILHDIFFGDRLINFGKDNSYSQQFSLTPHLTLPNILGLNRFVDLTTGYRSDYHWANNLQQQTLGRSATVTAQFTLGLNLRLKQLTDPWFAPRDSAAASPGLPTGRAESGRRRIEASETQLKEKTQQQGESEVKKEQPEERREAEPAPDTTKKVSEGKELPQSTEEKGGLPSVRDILRILIKTPFLDYDNISVNFSQQNSNQNTGLVGRTGFVNFWGRLPFFQKSLPENGPSRLYQLGLVSDPSGDIRNFGFRSRFPFFGVDLVRGPRAPGNLVDNFSQSNKLDLKTSRQIVEGLRIDLTWRVGWSYNRNETLISDSATGTVTVQSAVTTGNIERSYFTFPQIFPIKIFKNDISEVARRFQSLQKDQGDQRPDQEKLAQAFEDGFETLPFLKSVFGRFVPRANWSIRWDGLEKLPYLRNFASRVSFENSYTSTFSRQWRGDLGGGEITESERMMYGFAPLAGVNMTFQDFLKGNLGATIRYSTTTTYDLSTASRNLVESYNKEISFQGSFGRRGFAIPFFGLTLTNDIDLSLSYTYSRNTRKTYDVGNIDAGAVPLEGSSRTVIEPRIKYVLSTRVTASLYYRYTSVEPDQGASLIPGTKTNEAGLDVHISIQ